MRKFLFVIFVTLSSVGILVPGAASAASVTPNLSPPAMPKNINPANADILTPSTNITFSPSANGSEPLVTCDNWKVLITVYNDDWSWNNSASPYTMYLRDDNKTETRYCESGTGDDIKFYQYGTSRCLYVQASPRHVIEGDCASGQALWNIIEIESGPYYGYSLVQSSYNLACIWWNGSNSPVTYDPCDATNPKNMFY